MVAEIGNFALSLALGIALMITLLAGCGSLTKQAGLIRLAARCCFILLFMLIIAFSLLIYALAACDFSLVYVATNSNTQLPLHYRIASAWGAHEGSQLLWELLLAAWTVALISIRKRLPLLLVSRMIAIMGLFNTLFLAVIIISANPFQRLFPYIPLEGHSLNPLLQDLGLIIHPPLLYLGLSGLAIPFAWANAILSLGKIKAAWLNWIRPWLLAAWASLTLGIMVGAYWAYYELGWGGFWFWDPVENTALMPWLTATALMHSIIISERRRTFTQWTLFLAIITFILCLFSALLVRSGILVSVHAFAENNTRGRLLLCLFALIVLSSLFIYAIRARKLRGSIHTDRLWSRETLLYLTTLLLLTATVAILLGTVLPIVHKALGLGSISVGAPYFNHILSWLIIPFLLVLISVPMTPWQSKPYPHAVSSVLSSFLLSVILVLSFFIYIARPLPLLSAIILFLAVWLLLSTLILAIINKLTHHSPYSSHPKQTMNMAHLGFAIMIIGITLSQHYQIERNVALSLKGPAVRLGNYHISLTAITTQAKPHYQSEQFVLQLKKTDKAVETLYPEKRYYDETGQPTTEVALASDWLGNEIYAAPNSRLTATRWTFRLYYQPIIRWIWLGSTLMTLGALIALWRIVHHRSVCLSTKRH